VNGRELAVVQGWADTRVTLGAWSRSPRSVLAGWLGVAGAIAGLLLLTVAIIGSIATPDPTPRVLHGVNAPATFDDVMTIFGRNLLVLALHSMACLAGFIAKSSLPLEAESYAGRWRRVHDHAGPAAIAFVGGATLFSLCTQGYVLGSGLASLAPQLGTSPALLLVGLFPHAIPELVALFLPLAAWLVAARAEAWYQLQAATLATTAIALPVLFAAALLEVYVTPRLLLSLHFV
jgi:Stage II sporulation protein M